MQELSEQICFGGRQSTFTYDSEATGTAMRFGLYLPPASAEGPVSAVFYLAGLTCTEETGAIKAGAQRVAAELGLALVFPDTSPRGLELPGEHDDWDFGSGAGFYLDAIEAPWSAHYRMERHVVHELPERLVGFPIRTDGFGIMGHSMGGYGALRLGLAHPDRYRAISAFAPIASPTRCPWGQKAFRNYLGPDEETWADFDPTTLVRRGATAHHILVDQGLADGFLERELKPELLEAACREAGQRLTLRRHQGYDHSYWFIQTFMEDHLRHHATEMKT